MYLLDTNHCSRAILKDTQVLNRLKEIDSGLVATCVITQGELVDMAERSQRNQSNLNLVKKFLEGIYIYPADEVTATIYGQLKASIFKQFAPKEKSKRRKTKMVNLGFGENDLWIAAVALQHNLIVVSSDKDFQRIKQVEKELTVESWI